MNHRTRPLTCKARLGRVTVVCASVVLTPLLLPHASGAQTVPPTVFVFGQLTPVEEGSQAMFTVVAENPPDPDPITVSFSTWESGGTASDGADYWPVQNRTITLRPSQDPDHDYVATTTVSTSDDEKDEPPETIAAQIDVTSGNATEALGTAIVVINASDIDVPGVPPIGVPPIGVPDIPDLVPDIGSLFDIVPRLSINDVKRPEGTGGSPTIEFTVTRSQSTLLPVSVAYRTGERTAQEGEDYEETNGRLYFGIGVKERTINVPVVTDRTVEADEQFSVVLSLPIGAFVADGEGVATLVDDDRPPAVTASGPGGNTTPGGAGYWTHDRTGQTFAFGDAARLGSVRDHLEPHLASGTRIVGLAGQSDTGAWLADNRGGAYALGSAGFLGSLPGLVNSGQLAFSPEVADVAAAPGGKGYVLLGRDGGVFTFGDARFYGSLPGLVADGHLSAVPEATSIAYTPSGNGYWIAGADGGVFSFGDARFHGSMPGLVAAGAIDHVPRIVSLDPSPGGKGYLLVDEVGGVFTFGDARFHGSVPGLAAAGRIAHVVPVFGAAVTSTNDGYWMFGRTGGVYTFGDAPFFGATPFADA